MFYSQVFYFYKRKKSQECILWIPNYVCLVYGDFLAMPDCMHQMLLVDFMYERHITAKSIWITFWVLGVKRIAVFLPRLCRRTPTPTWPFKKCLGPVRALTYGCMWCPFPCWMRTSWKSLCKRAWPSRTTPTSVPGLRGSVWFPPGLLWVSTAE